MDDLRKVAMGVAGEWLCPSSKSKLCCLNVRASRDKGIFQRSIHEDIHRAVATKGFGKLGVS